MRLDKFLKNSRIIKRRTVANEACGAGRVSVNGKVAKAASEVSLGDIIDVLMAGKHARYRVLELSEHATKQGAAQMAELLHDEEQEHGR